MRKIFLIILLPIVNLIACSNNKNYYADDIEIFQNTPVWNLAQAIYQHDTVKINRLLEKHPEWVDYRESKFGISLLYWVIYNSTFYNVAPYGIKANTYYNETELLLKYNANPYIIDAEGETVIMQAANVYQGSKKFIELCLKSNYTQQLSNSRKRTLLSEALVVACGRVKPEELESVKLLVESGADINYFNNDSTKTPVSKSLIHENMKTARYLMIEQGAHFDYSIKFEVDRSDWYVLKILQNLNFKDDPEKDSIKQEILAYIERQKK